MTSTTAARRGYADTPLGQLHHVTQGSGPALLLLHQAARSSDEFRELVPLLAEDHHVVAMDMLGFGMSAAPRGPLTIEALAEAALALLDALDLPHTHVLGHHTGGAVAVELAARAPGRVTSLVLSSAPWCDAAYRRAHATGRGVDEAEQAADGSHLTTLWGQRRPHYPPNRPDLLDRFIRDALAPGTDPAEGHRACARYRMEDRIGLVTAPVLLLGADADPFALPALTPLRHHLAHAARTDVVVLPGGTVASMEQLPDAVAATVRAFHDRLPHATP